MDCIEGVFPFTATGIGVLRELDGFFPTKKKKE